MRGRIIDRFIELKIPIENIFKSEISGWKKTLDES